MARWKRIEQGGIARYVIIRAFFFGLFLFVLSRAYSNPPFPWYWTLTGQLVAGIVYGFVSWFLTMRFYARARGQR
jgi:hypothetical protein